jgi:peroxiredoxin
VTRRTLARALTAGLLLAAAACSKEPLPYTFAANKFKDDVRTNVAVTPEQLALSFVDGAGQPVSLADFRGQKPVVLVVMRGFPGYVCMFCSAQTAMLVKNHGEFVKRGAEVLVVYPGPRERLDDFVRTSREQVENAAVPFRILLDPDFKAVDQLGIRGELAKPSTYILDRQGQVRFAYVGGSASDRPSLKALLEQLDQLNQGG